MIAGVLGIFAACGTDDPDGSQPANDGGAASGGAPGTSGGTSGGSSSGSRGGASSSGSGQPDGSLPPTATDGKKDGDETDVDCGGASAPPCGDGKGCAKPNDCTSLVCTGVTCAAPTFADGVKNGTETDVDCGGAGAGPDHLCDVLRACLAHGDCATDGCDYTGHCALGRSCTPHHGGDSCGAGEIYVPEAGSQHESCCTALPVTGHDGMVLDKYNVTAGRMRAFIERVDEDVAGFITANKPSYWHDEWTPFLPTGHLTPTMVVGGSTRNLGVVGQFGPNFIYDQPGEFGCFLGPDADGTGGPTYYQPLADRQLENPNDVGHKYSQEMLDDRSLNCTSWLMLMAFCAWDGGRLPTYQEINDAWGAATYPWGNAPSPAGYSTGYPNPAALTPPDGDPLRANYRRNYPQTDPPWDYQPFDNSMYLAPPGRFPTGAGPDGHMDLAGNVFQMTSSVTNSDVDLREAPADTDWDPTSLPVRWSRSGSWEVVHDIPYTTFRTAALRKYWAAGARCAHDVE